jgi:signal transduction histidine kinase
MEPAVLLASQLVVVATNGGIALALVIAILRRPDLRRAWLPVLATLLLLVSTGFSAWGPSVISAAWFLCFPLLCFTFPNGTLSPRWTIVPLAVAVASTTVYVATDMRIADEIWWGPLAAILVILSVGDLLYRYARRLTADERMRLRWALLGVIIEVSLFLLIMIAEGGTVAGHGPLSVAAANIAGLWIAPAFAIGLAWPRLANVDRALRAVIALAFTALPLGLLCWSVVWLAAPLGATAGWIAGPVVAVTTIPLHRFATWAADRIVFRGRADPLESLRELGVRLDAQLDLTAVPLALVRLIHEALGFQTVQLRGPGDTHVHVGASGTTPITEFPVLYRGEQLAILAVQPRPTEITLTVHDAAIVAELVRQAAPALHGVRTFAELTDAQERIQRLRQSERARMRRDLHDDLAPTLAGLGLSATAILALAADRPAIAELAEGLRADTGAALAQVRELAHDLRPETLDQEGLLLTLRRRLVRTDAPPRIRITGPDGELHLDPRVELAALRIVQEAVTNARRHSGANHIDVLIGLDTSALLLEVRDDGIGIPHRPTAGMGLESMRARAAELGGVTVIAAAIEGGTVLRARLPLDPTADEVLDERDAS